MAFDGFADLDQAHADGVVDPAVAEPAAPLVMGSAEARMSARR
jgi:hypothetical protein